MSLTISRLLSFQYSRLIHFYNNSAKLARMNTGKNMVLDDGDAQLALRHPHGEQDRRTIQSFLEAMYEREQFDEPCASAPSSPAGPPARVPTYDAAIMPSLKLNISTAVGLVAAASFGWFYYYFSPHSRPARRHAEVVDVEKDRDY